MINDGLFKRGMVVKELDEDTDVGDSGGDVGDYLVLYDWFEVSAEEREFVAQFVELDPLPIVLDLSVHSQGALRYRVLHRLARPYSSSILGSVG